MHVYMVILATIADCYFFTVSSQSHAFVVTLADYTQTIGNGDIIVWNKVLAGTGRYNPSNGNTIVQFILLLAFTLKKFH